jgi:hypothetical protein
MHARHNKGFVLRQENITNLKLYKKKKMVTIANPLILVSLSEPNFGVVISLNNGSGKKSSGVACRDKSDITIHIFKTRKSFCGCSRTWSYILWIELLKTLDSEIAWF